MLFKESRLTLISLINHRGISPHQLFCFLRDDIDEHFVFIDDGIEDSEKETIKKGFKALKNLYGLSYECACEVHDEDSDDSMSALIRFAFKKAAHSELIIDVTETLGTTAAMLSAELLTAGVKFAAYNPEENEITIFDKYEKKTIAPKHKFGIADRIAALGFRLESVKELQDITLIRENIYTIFGDPKKFDTLRNTLKAGSAIPKNTKLFEALSSLDAITSSGKIMPKKQKLIDGELFELFCAVTMADMGFDGVATGVVVEFEDGVKHEFDIMILQGGRLHIGECKYTSSFGADSIIFKYDALRQHLDPYAKAFIIHSGFGGGEHFDDTDKKRAAAFDMGILSKERITKGCIEEFVGSFLLGREVKEPDKEEMTEQPQLKREYYEEYIQYTDLEGYDEFKRVINSQISATLKNHIGYKVFKALNKLPNRIDRLLSVDESFDEISRRYLNEYWQTDVGKKVYEALDGYNEACKKADRAAQKAVIDKFLDYGR